MSEHSGIGPSEILAALEDMLLSRRLLIAGFGLLMYDWLLSLSSEVQYIWSNPQWSSVKVIFLLNRYIIPTLQAFAIYGWSGSATIFDRTGCFVWTMIDALFNFLFFVSLHYVVTLRVWILWGRSKKFGLFLWSVFAVYFGVTGAITAVAMHAINVDFIPVVNVCFGPKPSFMWAIWAPSIVLEFLLFALTMTKAIHHARNRVDTPVLSTLYRDGFLYFLFISANSLGNLFWWLLTPDSKIIVLRHITVAVSQIVGSHLILDLLVVGQAVKDSIHQLSQQRLPVPVVFKRVVVEQKFDDYEMKPAFRRYP